MKARYRYDIEDGERKVYARQCNILLRKKEISADLWDITFDIFISDSEKEEFLKEFQHKKELSEFYITHGRFREAFGYNIKLGDLEEALELIINRGPKNGIFLKESEDDLQMKEIFKYAQTRKLFSKITKPSAASVDLSYDQSPSGNSWINRPWADLVATANGYFKDGIKPDRNSIQDNWIKDYMDTIVSDPSHLLSFSQKLINCLDHL